MSLASPGQSFHGDRRDPATRLKRVYTLGPILAAGGEGTVFRGAPGEVYKVYHQRPDQQQQAKIAALVRMSKPGLAAVSAWPLDALYGTSGVIGFVMPAIEHAMPLHQYFTPADRLRLAPAATYANQIAISANLSRGMATFHHGKIVIGDNNGQNVLVMPDNTIRYLDIDSVQIAGHPCTVGVEDFLAPELQGVTLASVKRTESHDAFALAIMIFHLLVVGRHPFAGSDAPTLGAAIKRGDYMLERRWTGTDPLTAIGLPPRALFPARIAALFDRAFTPGLLSRRPSPLEWLNALEDFYGTLKTCQGNVSHVYSPTAIHCPWCALERQGIPPLFLPPTVPVLLWQPPPRVWWRPSTWW